MEISLSKKRSQTGDLNKQKHPQKLLGLMLKFQGFHPSAQLDEVTFEDRAQSSGRQARNQSKQSNPKPSFPGILLDLGGCLESFPAPRNVSAAAH